MSQALAVIGPQLPSEEFVSTLNAEYDAWKSAYQNQLEHAIAVGTMLHQAKGKLPHGDWKRWLAENFHGSYQSAHVAMQIAGAWTNDKRSLQDTNGHMPQSIRGALSAIKRNKHASGSTLNRALRAVDAASVEDPPPEAEVVYPLTLPQLTLLAQKRWHRKPDEEDVLGWLRAEGLAA